MSDKLSLPMNQSMLFEEHEKERVGVSVKFLDLEPEKDRLRQFLRFENFGSKEFVHFGAVFVEWNIFE